MSFSPNTFINNVHKTYENITSIILKTPLLHSKWLSSENNCNVFLKMESEQITNSFKLRGAASKIIKLIKEDPDNLSTEGFVTASSGNHALACAYVAELEKVKTQIYTHKRISSIKKQILNSFPNVVLNYYGEECCEAEIHAREEAKKKGLIYVSPYNDIDIINGQATIGLELFSQLPNLDTVFVSVGGGGLISGIALYLKLINPSIEIIGCQAINDCCMHESISAGKLIQNYSYLNTFADGAAGKVEPGSITFEICQKYVDKWVLVNEEDIEKAVYDVLINERKIIEGSAGLTIAALRKTKIANNKNVALIVCGGNIGIKSLNYLFEKYAKPNF
ncbi:L-threonine dehydratase catabolic TdcB [Hydra vulgaris]|uniref:L-threonine dehydratase catabolic TdcB n=1 Tax=Hydra vulgaris TaxID=6087 RepID=UPI000640DAF2|nr:L-threonine dehydratase catabolic TdcB [Hydra vulgaris]